MAHQGRAWGQGKAPVLSLADARTILGPNPEIRAGHPHQEPRARLSLSLLAWRRLSPFGVVLQVVKKPSPLAVELNPKQRSEDAADESTRLYNRFKSHLSAIRVDR